MKYILLATLFLSAASLADEKVKHCINLETGEVITVKAGYPCPFPTTEL